MVRKFLVKWKPLILCLAISLGAGGISALITGKSMEIYKTLARPPLSPPSMVFPIVWTILFALMGISSYMVLVSENIRQKAALRVYGIQLFVNILWSPIFFRFESFWFAFGWLILLWLLIIATIILFYRINKTASWLLFPYFLWVTFAGYLNFGIAVLNR